MVQAGKQIIRRKDVGGKVLLEFLGAGDGLALFGEGWFWIVVHGEISVLAAEESKG